MSQFEFLLLSLTDRRPSLRNTSWAQEVVQGGASRALVARAGLSGGRQYPASASSSAEMPNGLASRRRESSPSALTVLGSPVIQTTGAPARSATSDPFPSGRE